jgi:FkbM family methyltransferase
MNKKIIYFIFTFIFILSIQIYFQKNSTEKFNLKLNKIHQKINLDFGDMKEEYPEQIMILKHLNKNSRVFELGPNIGRSSLIINYILDDKTQHLCIESNEDSANKLKINREKNNMKFSILNFAISNKPLYQSGWNTYDEYKEGRELVKTISLSEILNKYKIDFNTIVADCEGCLIQILKDNPKFINQINTIIIEHDFKSSDDYNYFIKLMEDNKFKLTDSMSKKELNMLDWKKEISNDELFVSVWSK